MACKTYYIELAQKPPFVIAADIKWAVVEECCSVCLRDVFHLALQGAGFHVLHFGLETSGRRHSQHMLSVSLELRDGEVNLFESAATTRQCDNKHCERGSR